MNAILRHSLFALSWVALVLLLCWCAGLRVNLTPSLPQGVYIVRPGTPGKGDLVTFCLEGKFADLARERGYLVAGSCPSGLRPLLKRITGLPGDAIPGDLFIRSVDSLGRAPYLRRCRKASFPPAWPCCWRIIPALSTAAISGLCRWMRSSGSSLFLSSIHKENCHE